MKREYEYLCRLLKNKEYIKALRYTSNCIKRDSDDENIYVCYILLKIYEVENKCGIINHIFLIPEVQYDDLSEIRSLYQNLKFRLRRYEYDLDEESKEEAIKYLKKTKVSGIALYYITNYACIDRKKVLEKLIITCYENNMTDIVEQINKIK